VFKKNRNIQKPLFNKELLTTPFSGPKEKLLKITRIEPDTAFIISEDEWNKKFLDPPLAIFDSYSKLIFIKENELNLLEHLFIHEALHSIQRGGYDQKDAYFQGQMILLEGVTEEVASSLNQDFGFYLKERMIFKKIQAETDFLATELVFFRANKLFSFLATDIFSDKRNPLKELDRLIKSYL
jgi:hypothetical protein